MYEIGIKRLYHFTIYVADLPHGYNLIDPQTKYPEVFIDIKGFLFSPLRLQYLPDMLLVLVLDDSHISGSGPKIAPICLCTTIAPPLVTYCSSSTLLDF